MPDRGYELEPGVGFLRTVPQDGYAWWYVDALSTDGRYGLTIIAFIGSVFSPYYAWARRKGRGDPANHCSFNVALYGPDKRRWSMTERGASALTRTADSLTVGPSWMQWDNSDGLTIDIAETSVPSLRPIRGKIRLRAAATFDQTFPLDEHGRHKWRPIAPVASVEVKFDRPGLDWSGHGYFDSNFGEEPLENAFSTWDWSRMEHLDHTSVLYDSRDLTNHERSLSLRFSPDGRVTSCDAPSRKALPRTPWRMNRATRCREGSDTRVIQTLEDSPFYARSIIEEASADGKKIIGMHESLSLSRFKLPIVQAMLPFRMPRIVGRA